VEINIKKPLFIFEIANNHTGSLEHGLTIIREIHEVSKEFGNIFDFAFKLQYRHLYTFIHPEFQTRQDLKYIKRFSETRLDETQFKKLRDEMSVLGVLSVCTPFDEKSVTLIEEHHFDILKIASCSFTDWPLLERVAQSSLPIIASTAGVQQEEMDKVVSFFEHRCKDFALMHCVAEYPTSVNGLQLNQMNVLKLRYPKLRIGYSTHESPSNFDAIKMAIAKGATIFEKHVGVPTESIKLNDYSANPEQVQRWLESAKIAFEMCGVVDKRPEFTETEKSSLFSLRRGVFAKTFIKKGEQIDLSNTFLAIPTIENQITANDMSKYTHFYAEVDIDVNCPIFLSHTKQVETRDKVYSIVQLLKGILKESQVIVPNQLDFEISHHYGIDRFNEFGATLINCINRSYCKKLIIMLAGQKHPEQYHKRKEETFLILYGDVQITLDGVETSCKVGDIITIEKNVKHAFSTTTGCVFEEISSTHYPDDSYYTDSEITKKKNRKTLLTYWID